MKFLALKFNSYQLVPLIKLITNRQNALLICDGVGVGKTISAGYILTYLTLLERRPAMVICPPGLQAKWQIELKEKFQLPTTPIRSREELHFALDNWNDESNDPAVVILPSSLLQYLPSISFRGAVVIDEIHNYRNRSSKAWSALNNLICDSSFRVGLSATPINNGLTDLGSELSLLLNMSPDIADALVSDLWRPEKQNILYVLMTRFSKEKLGLHFARRHVRDLNVELSAEYSERVVATIKSLRSRPASEKIFRDEITYFRLAASSPIAFCKSTGMHAPSDDRKLQHLCDLLHRHAEEPVIVFCEFELTAQEIANATQDRRSFLITGAVPVFERAALLSQFRSSENGVLVLTSVGAEGLDLQFCSTLINYDLTWNPMILEQRIGRIDRIGQAKETIAIYNFVVQGSIDARIISTLGRKLGLIEGSVLEPQTVLASGRDYPFGNLVADEFDLEVSKARALVRAVELSSGIIPRDYELASMLSAELCDLESVRTSAQSKSSADWVREVTSSNWISSMEEQSSLFAATVQHYAA